MSLYARLAATPGGPQALAGARLRRQVEIALHGACAEVVAKPGRLRIDDLAALLHRRGYELDVQLVPAGTLRARALST